MNAPSPPVLGRFAKQTVVRVAITGLVMGFACASAATPPPEAIALKRIHLEIRELTRLVALLKRDEKQARSEREKVARYCGNAQQFASGGSRVQHRTYFMGLLERFEQSPGQASLLQAHVSELEADNFVPQPTAGFAGGDVGQLVQFCRDRKLTVRYGSRAQLVIAELARDLISQADARIEELDQRIEHYKAQNIAHSDLIGKLMLCARHCHGCHACYHYGYGCCGAVPALGLDHPIAGLNSQAYDTTRPPTSIQPATRRSVVTDRRRLKFLTPDAPSRATQPATNQIAESEGRQATKNRTERPYSGPRGQ